MAKLYFQHHYSSLHCHMILQKFADLLLKKHFHLSILKTVVLLNIFNQIFCNIINVFILTFDQFNASLLNKSISFFQTTF
ncbi:hypothetical protein PO909_009159 [Leuciscus waleckii]